VRPRILVLLFENGIPTSFVDACLDQLSISSSLIRPYVLNMLTYLPAPELIVLNVNQRILPAVRAPLGQLNDHYCSCVKEKQYPLM
jgi:hypothetical protein